MVRKKEKTEEASEQLLKIIKDVTTIFEARKFRKFSVTGIDDKTITAWESSFHEAIVFSYFILSTELYKGISDELCSSPLSPLSSICNFTLWALSHPFSSIYKKLIMYSGRSGSGSYSILKY